MSDPFLRRWSRLKRQAPPQPQPPAPVSAPEPPDEVPPDAETIPLDEVATWLRRRVPEAWRVAALRRLWASDPAIAGFIGPADYQFDWESLGGSPGWGPLRAVDDITRLLARAIGEPLPPPPETVSPNDVQTVAAAPEQADRLTLAVSEPIENAPQFADVADPRSPPPRRRGGGATPI